MNLFKNAVIKEGSSIKWIVFCVKKVIIIQCWDWRRRTWLQNLNNYIKFWPILTTFRELWGTMLQWYNIITKLIRLVFYETVLSPLYCLCDSERHFFFLLFFLFREVNLSTSPHKPCNLFIFLFIILSSYKDLISSNPWWEPSVLNPTPSKFGNLHFMHEIGLSCIFVLLR